MSIVREESIVYTIVSGTHGGKECVIRADPPRGHAELIGVVFTGEGEDPNRIVDVRIGTLAALEAPGWADDFPYDAPCKFEKYNLKELYHKTKRLRDTYVTQPSVVKEGDILASGEIVVEAPRRGWNSSVLIRLDRTGWVEVSPRLPIALKGSGKFRFPINLRMGDRLATDCLVVKQPTSSEVNWTDVCLDREDCRIEVASCLPLALK
ncbi:MAG: hypothetical protein HGA31_06520 [Candidatus Moranbacteria bacterium]|nr:hypothetical protein [Candidatus Moranbacteria bacterium]